MNLSRRGAQTASIEMGRETSLRANSGMGPRSVERGGRGRGEGEQNEGKTKRQEKKDFGREIRAGGRGYTGV